MADFKFEFKVQGITEAQARKLMREIVRVVVKVGEISYQGDGFREARQGRGGVQTPD
jgi:hypothetical protein